MKKTYHTARSRTVARQAAWKAEFRIASSNRLVNRKNGAAPPISTKIAAGIHHRHLRRGGAAMSGRAAGFIPAGAAGCVVIPGSGLPPSTRSVI